MVGHSDGEWIEEDSLRVLKADAVLAKIGSRFRRVVAEEERHASTLLREAEPAALRG